MPKKRYRPEEIIQHLRTVEIETGKGLAVLDAPKGFRKRAHSLFVSLPPWGWQGCQFTLSQ